MAAKPHIYRDIKSANNRGADSLPTEHASSRRPWSSRMVFQQQNLVQPFKMSQSQSALLSRLPTSRSILTPFSEDTGRNPSKSVGNWVARNLLSPDSNSRKWDTNYLSRKLEGISEAGQKAIRGIVFTFPSRLNTCIPTAHESTVEIIMALRWLPTAPVSISRTATSNESEIHITAALHSSPIT